MGGGGKKAHESFVVSPSASAVVIADDGDEEPFETPEEAAAVEAWMATLNQVLEAKASELTGTAATDAGEPDGVDPDAGVDDIEPLEAR